MSLPPAVLYPDGVGEMALLRGTVGPLEVVGDGPAAGVCGRPDSDARAAGVVEFLRRAVGVFVP